MSRLMLVEGLCTYGWEGCPETYTRGHLCKRQQGHPGRHKCYCDATTAGRALDGLAAPEGASDG